MAKRRPHKKGVSALTKAQLSEWNRLKQQVSRAKREARAEDKKFNYGAVKGKVNKARSKRGKAYGKLTKANKEIVKFRSKYGIGAPPKRKRKARKKLDVENKIRQYPENVWTFERNYFTTYVNGKIWKYIVFKNSGTRINARRTSPSKIFQLYDAERNMAYTSLFANTPWVNVTEDKMTSTLTLEFLS
jgi:hypothetical protein